MSKYRKKVEEHVEERWVESVTLCDFCKRDLDDVSQAQSSYDYSRIKLDAKIGPTYPEGDSRQGYKIDCCVECFESKVKPAIEALGVAWLEYSPEDTYTSCTYGNYWKDDVMTMGGQMTSEIEKATGVSKHTDDSANTSPESELAP